MSWPPTRSRDGACCATASWCSRTPATCCPTAGSSLPTGRRPDRRLGLRGYAGICRTASGHRPAGTCRSPQLEKKRWRPLRGGPGCPAPGVLPGVACMNAWLRWPRAGPGPGRLQSRGGAREEGQDFGRWRFPGWLAVLGAAGGAPGIWERLRRPSFLPGHVAGCGQAADDAAGAALGDAQAARDVAQPHARRADRPQHGSGEWSLAGQFAACLQVAQDRGYPAVVVFGVGYVELAEYVVT